MKLIYEYKVCLYDIQAHEDGISESQFWHEMNQYCEYNLGDNIYTHFIDGGWIFYIRYLEDWAQFKLRWC